ncbi:unnamed protein product [Camellia sinensis]
MFGGVPAVGRSVDLQWVCVSSVGFWSCSGCLLCLRHRRGCEEAFRCCSREVAEGKL